MKRIHIPRAAIVCLFIGILSICGLFACIIKINAYHHPLPFSQLSEDTFKQGRYVSGTITSYVISPRMPKGKDSYDYFGTLDTYSGGGYIGYIVPFNQEQYIRIWMNDSESLALLNQTQDGYHVNAPFVGQIKAVDSANSFTDDRLGFDHNKVITNYEIVQKNLNTEKFWIKVCILGLVIAILLYFQSGKVEISTDAYDEFENKNPQVVPHYYDLSAEINVIEKRITMYEKMEKEYMRWGCVGLVCVAVGGIILVKVVTFSAMLVSFALICYGVRQLWSWFIHSKNKLAVYLAGIFHINTLQSKRKEAYELLDALRKTQEQQNK